MAGIAAEALRCAGLEVFPQELCIVMPGGGEICVQLPDLGFPQPIELVKGLFAQLNSALTPLTPFFSLLDLVLTIVNCVKGIPQGPGELPPFKTLIGCIPGLIEKAAKLLALIPPLSIPFTILGFIDATLTLLQGFVLQLTAMVEKLDQILEAETRATALGSSALSLIVDCANADVDAQMANLNEGLKPLSLIFGLINTFIALVGLNPIPNLADLGVNPVDALEPLQTFIATLTAIRRAIPV